MLEGPRRVNIESGAEEEIIATKVKSDVKRMRKDSTVAINGVTAQPPPTTTTTMNNCEVRVKCASDKLRRASIAAAVAAANNSLNKRVSFAESRRRRMSHAAVIGKAAPPPPSFSITSSLDSSASTKERDGHDSVLETTTTKKPSAAGRLSLTADAHGQLAGLRTSPSVQRAQSNREIVGGQLQKAIANNGQSSWSSSSTSFRCPKRSSSFHESILRCGGDSFQVLMLGAAGVGKSSLVSQASKMEHIRIKVSNIYGDNCRRANDCQLVILDNPANDITAEVAMACCDVDAYVIVYSVTDRDSFRTAQRIVKSISSQENFNKRAAILVGNKVDLVRKRVVTIDEGKACATAGECKFIETSDWINYNVDELFEGVLTQILLRLDSANCQFDEDRSSSTPGSSPANSSSSTSSSASGQKGYKGKRERRNYRRSKTLGAKSWGMFKDLINKINRKVKSCDDLHVL